MLDLTVFWATLKELGHVSDDMAKAIIHLDVGRTQGGQLGSGVCMGKPAGWWGLSLGSHIPTPTPSGRPARGKSRCWGWGLWPQSLVGGAAPVVTEKDGPIAVAMLGSPAAQWPVYSPGCLLPVPVMPREELRGRGGAPSCRLEHYQPTPALPLTWSPAPPSSTSHLAPSPALGLHSIQELHLKENPWGPCGWVRRPVTITPRPFMSAGPVPH